MTNLYRHISLTLALSILLSSVGIALPRHICLMTGIVQKAPAASEESCCRKKAACDEETVKIKKTSEEDACCALSVEHEKLNPEASLKGSSVQFQALSPALLPVLQACWQAPLQTTQQEILTYSDSSPPLYGRSLLTQIQILII
jgi:hypothetical protein